MIQRERLTGQNRGGGGLLREKNRHFSFFIPSLPLAYPSSLSFSITFEIVAAINVPLIFHLLCRLLTESSGREYKGVPHRTVENERDITNKDSVKTIQLNRTSGERDSLGQVSRVSKKEKGPFREAKKNAVCFSLGT